MENNHFRTFSAVWVSDIKLSDKQGKGILPLLTLPFLPIKKCPKDGVTVSKTPVIVNLVIPVSKPCQFQNRSHYNMFGNWAAWSLAPSFCCVWIIRSATHTNEIWDQIVLSCRTDGMECSATGAARNRWLCVFPEKTENFSFHPGLWSWLWYLTKIKVDFDFELIVRRRWPCM